MHKFLSAIYPGLSLLSLYEYTFAMPPQGGIFLKGDSVPGKGFIEFMQIKTLTSEKGFVEMTMPILSEYLQPFGYLHGGATITLLETAASIGAAQNVDLEKERPFGVEVRVCHRKSGRSGMLRGVAKLDRREGNKQFWDVVAYDDAGDVVSEGEIVCKVVSLERLAEKEREKRENKE